MSDIITNLTKSVFTNPITMIFLIITTVYSVVKILENRNLYNFIKDDLVETNDDYKKSRLYLNTKSKYDKYIQENPYADINITSFIEEIISGFTCKNKFILEEIKSIKNASSLCILLGVLGTFVGLSMMLLTVNTKDIINSLPVTISSMQTAFTTSIFGIVCSIVINFSIKIRDCEHVLIQLMLKLENLLTSETTHLKSERIDNKVEEVKNTIKQISKSIEAIERFDKISKDLNDFNDSFISGIEALKGLLEGSESSIKTFDQSVRKLDKQFSILNIKFDKLFDTYDNQEDINREILLDIKESSKSIYNSTENQYKIKEYIKNINACFGLYERTVQDLVANLISHETQIIDNQNNLSKEKVNINNTVKDLSNIISTSSKEIQDKLDVVFNYLDLYKEASNMIQVETYPLNEEIYEIENEIDMLTTEDIYTTVKEIDKDDQND